MRRKWAAMIVLFALAGCATRDAGPRSAAPAGPVSVQAVTLQPATITRTIEQPGTVRADEEVEVQARISGYVAALSADIGKEVKKDELLARLSVPERIEENNQKQAQIIQAAAELRQAVKAEASARAKVDVRKALAREAKEGLSRADALVLRWQSEAQRISTLTDRGVIDAQSRDEVANQHKAALAGREEAKARVASANAGVVQGSADQDKAVADVAAARARLGVSHAAARQAEAMLAFRELRAPFAGIISRRHVNTGDLLRASADKAVGVFTVVRLDPVRVVVAVPEADAALVQPGMAVQLTLPALRPAARLAKVTRTSWALDPRSRTLRAEIDLDNKGRTVRPGMYVRATMTASVPARTTLPAAAVGRQGDDLVAYRLDDGKATLVVLRTGLRDEKHVEVLEYRRPGAVVWTAPTGKEAFVARLSPDLTDGGSVTVTGN